ncbi:transcription elongation factor TFIIS-like [Melia azedarach]|uniref:Transcription elongation factor TFIIS-like n=1 Tax=Melia azedarach TaxID=155640 RepID=A0ACC1XXP2_MELAZ|nr:transcription elongation factor TFIIS-like [Melia azedarach]
MEEELLRLVESALKAAETAAEINGVSAHNCPEVCRCVALLKKLKEQPVSFDVLASTQVDKRLRHLRNHNKEKVRLVAKWLLDIWSAVIKDGLSRNRRNDKLFDNKRKVHEGEVRVLKEFVVKKKAVRETLVCKQEQQKQTEKCSDASRNKVREILAEGLRKVTGEVAEEDDEEMKEKVRACDPDKVAVSVESVMFKKLGPFNGAKKVQYRSIMFNVKDPNNKDFRRKILVGEVKPERVVGMSTEEMASDERQIVIKERNEKVLYKIQDSVEEESTGKADKEAIWLESMK